MEGWIISMNVLTKIELIGFMCLHARDCAKKDLLSRWEITNLYAKLVSNSGFYLSICRIFYPMNVGSSTRLHTPLHCRLLLRSLYIYIFFLMSETLGSLISVISYSSSSFPPSLFSRHTTQGQMGGEAPDVSLINSHLAELKNQSISATVTFWLSAIQIKLQYTCVSWLVNMSTRG